VVSQPAALWDLLPTFAELTFTQMFRKTMDGVSFGKLLKADREMPPHLLYWETPDAKAQAVRLGQWKGFRPAGSQSLKLYDLNEDPGETKDVADQHPEMIQRLTKPAEPKEI
jgi:arylsulfatase A-like enzyme